MSTKTIFEYRNNIQKFANKHKILFEDEGECGFGRECVGLLKGGNYIAFNPNSQAENTRGEAIDEFYDDRFYDIQPSLAYHKYDCLAVLGRGDESIIQLSNWVDELNKLNATIEEYKTGATGLQAIISGYSSYTFKIPKKEMNFINKINNYEA